MVNSPITLTRYIRLTCDEKLDGDIAKKWFSTVRNKGPESIVGSVQVEGPDNTLKNVQLIHRTVGDKHHYDVPLVRDLTGDELNRIKGAWKDGGTIESSAPEVKDARVQLFDGVEIPETSYKEMCWEIAKLQHARWVQERMNEGWRYGDRYSARDKVHPMLKPWDDLPQQYQKVDYRLPLDILGVIKKYY